MKFVFFQWIYHFFHSFATPSRFQAKSYILTYSGETFDHSNVCLFFNSIRPTEYIFCGSKQSSKNDTADGEKTLAPSSIIHIKLSYIAKTVSTLIEKIGVDNVLEQGTRPAKPKNASNCMHIEKLLNIYYPKDPENGSTRPQKSINDK